MIVLDKIVYLLSVVTEYSYFIILNSILFLKVLNLPKDNRKQNLSSVGSLDWQMGDGRWVSWDMEEGSKYTAGR